MKRILVTGVNGLVGTDLAANLKGDNVAGLDIGENSPTPLARYDRVDVRDLPALEKLIAQFAPDEVYHLAGLLSVGGEENPDLAWQVNIGGLKNILDLAVKYKFRVFWPSSIAVFGPATPGQNTPQNTVLDPTTIYGVTKVTGELLCRYYFRRFGVDVRSLRYPGLIAWKAPPGNGTTEYAVHIFHAAAAGRPYTCFLKPDTRLPMMYIDDAVAGTLQLMAAPAEKLSVRTGYNFSSLSFTPAELAAEITRQLPGFTVRYQPDDRQNIADSWPGSVDDSPARADWGWQPQFDLPGLVSAMLDHLKNKALL